MEKNKGLKFQLSREQMLRLVEKECEIEDNYSVEVGSLKILFDIFEKE